MDRAVDQHGALTGDGEAPPPVIETTTVEPDPSAGAGSSGDGVQPAAGPAAPPDDGLPLPVKRDGKV